MAPPRIFSPPWRLALGAALAFYPSPSRPLVFLGLAALAAGFKAGRIVVEKGEECLVVSPAAASPTTNAPSSHHSQGAPVWLK